MTFQALRRTLLRLAVLLILSGAGLIGSTGFAQTDPEYRGIWVDTWGAGFRTAAEIDALVARAQRGNFNVILPQIRRRGDAFYNSTIEPKNTSISSSFDPLAYLVQKAHAANPPIEVHAWIVAYPIWANKETPPGSPDHVFNKHPEWLSENIDGVKWDGTDVNGNYYVDPGHPGVQRHTFDVSMDVISRYDVDGFHLDYIRYSSRNFGYNPVAVERFNTRFGRTGKPATTDTAWLQFRRDQVTALVRRIYLESVALKPEMKISAATIGFAPGITSTADWPKSAAYADKLQDWRAWMEEGILDVNMPMFYFDQEQYATAWARWNTFAKNHKYNRHLAVGLGWWLNTVENTLWQTRDTRVPTSLGHRGEGNVGFQYRRYSKNNNDGVTQNAFFDAFSKPSIYDSHATPVFPQQVPTPDMPWKSSTDRGHLKGYVSNADTGGVFDYALVTLSGPQSRTLRTDGNGFFGTLDLLPGTYTVTASMPGSHYESRSTDVTVAGGQVALADIELFVEPSADIVMDNPDGTFSGSWSTLSHDSQHGADHRRTLTTTNSSATATATFQPYITIPGVYDILVWYVDGDTRASDAPYTIRHSEGEETVRFDQRTGGGAWQLLASGKHFGLGNDGFVRLGNNASGNNVIADAVRFTLVEADPDPALFFSEPAVYPGGLTATVAFSTERPATVQIEYGPSQNDTSMNSATTTPVDAHSVKLTGLLPGQTYHARLHATEDSRTYASNWFTFGTVPEIIVDNKGAGASFTGTWSTGAYGVPHNEDYRWTSTVTGSPTHTATFRPNLPAAGTYDVFTWYVHGTNRTSDARYEVTHSSGTAHVSIDQKTGGQTWVRLAQDLQMNAGNDTHVRIANQSNTGGGALMADAQRWLLVEPEITHTLAVASEGSGTVTRSPSTSTYAHGATVELTADPAEGWVFSHWEGHLETDANPASITLYANRELTAVFRQLFELNITVTGEGIISVAPHNALYAEGDLVELTATPNEGWEFAGWTGDISDFDNPLSLLINDNKTVVASFIAVEGSSFAAWRNAHFTEAEQGDETISGPQADPHGHGIPNLLKYAFGINVAQPELDRLPKIEVVDGHLTVIFHRLLQYSDIEYIVEVSSDLADWQPAGDQFSETRVEPNADEQTENVTLRANAPAEGQRQFVRVRVNQL